MNAFKHQSAGAVGVDFSNVYFIGNTSFVENEAEFGGTIDIGGPAHINVQGSIIFQNNQAKYGGAVAVVYTSVTASLKVFAGIVI